MSGNGAGLETVYQKWLRKNGFGPDGNPSPQVIRELAEEKYPKSFAWLKSRLSRNKGLIKVCDIKIGSQQPKQNDSDRTMFNILAYMGSSALLATRALLFSVEAERFQRNSYQAENVKIDQLMSSLDRGDAELLAVFLVHQIYQEINGCNDMVLDENIRFSQQDLSHKHQQINEMIEVLHEVDPSRASSMMKKRDQMISLQTTHQLLLQS